MVKAKSPVVFGERRVVRRNPFGAAKRISHTVSRVASSVEELGLASRLGPTEFFKARQRLLAANFSAVLARKSLRDIAARDPKFEIDNDARFNEQAFSFLRSSAARTKPFSFAIIDLDLLRKINKNAGHAGGDRALDIFTRGLAGVAKKSNVSGFAGKFGGDEVKLIARCSPLLLRSALESLAVEMKKQGVTFSAGIASSASAKKLMGKTQALRVRLDAQADSALYAAKKAGRNRVNIF